MKSKIPRYRLSTRDLSWGSETLTPTPREAVPQVKHELPQSHFYRVKQAMDHLYLPHIGELLGRISTYGLAPWQRSCHWARGWRIHECSVRLPRAIVPFIDDEEVLDENAREIIATGKEAERVENELKAVAGLSSDDPGELDLTTLMGQIAALSLFECTKWGRKHRVEIFEEALCSSEISYYLAAAINPTTDEWPRLIESMSKWPRFSYAALNLPHLPISAFLIRSRKLLTESVSKDTLFNWALQFGYHRIDCTHFSDASLANPYSGIVESGLALVLAPHDPRALEWLADLEGQPQLAYEIRRLLSLSGQLDAEALHAPKLAAIAREHPKWLFHLLRDYGEGDIDSLTPLLPNLEWIAELIDLRVFPLEHASVIDDLAANTMGLEHWLRSGFLLLCAERKKARANE